MEELRAETPARAVLARLDLTGGSLDTLELSWNPSSYRLARGGGSAAQDRGASTGPGSSTRLSTELFLDTTSCSGDERDARRTAERIRAWMEPRAESLRPPRVLFLWGPLRFVGAIEEMEEEWTRFDPDGTPVRGRVRLSLRG